MAENEAGISPNTPMQDLIGQMNYQAATSAAGLNLSKQMNNMLTAVNMNVGKVNASVTKVDGTLQKLHDMSKAINMNIGKVNANITALGKRHDDTNKILSDILRGIGGKANGINVYDAVENKMEQKDVSSNIQIMTDTLKSIDETLKKLGTGSGTSSNPSTPNPQQSSSFWSFGNMARLFSGAALMGAGDYYLQNNTKNNSGAQWLGYGAGAAGGALAGSYFGVPGMAIGAGVGVVQSALNDTALKQSYGRSLGYTYSQEEQRAAEAQKKQLYDSFKNSKFSTSWRGYFIDDNWVSKDAYDDAMGYVRQQGKSVSVDGRYFPPSGGSGFNFDASKASYPKNTSRSMAAPASLPDGIVLGSMETKSDLDQQQADIEKQAKGITKSELLYEATDVIYKATNIRFEAASIVFGGGQAGGAGGRAGGVGMMNGVQMGSGTNAGGWQGGDGNPGGSSSAVGAARLTPEQRSAIDKLEKNGSYMPNASETTALAGLSNEQLKALGISKKEVRGAHGGTQYSYDASKATEKDFLPKEARALLDTISAPGLEGADYNRIVGKGGTFSDFSKHPNKVGITTAQGPSTAAGRYQITATTWKELQANHPDLTDFSPVNQDKAAWYLAQERYAKATGGRNLEEDLKSKDPKIIQGISNALSGTWSSLQGGVHQGKAAGNFSRMYAENLQKGGQGGTLADRVGNKMPTSAAGENGGKQYNGKGGVISPVSGVFEGTPNAYYGAPRGNYSPGGSHQHGPKNRKHSGSDWTAENGSSAVFPVDGTVIHVGNHSGYGTMVDILGSDGNVYRMATHGSVGKFKVGQNVKQGDTAGTISSGHLHMEVIPPEINGKQNPVYKEFMHQLRSGQGGFVGTGNQRGTVDQEKLFGISRYTKVSQGQYVVQPQSSVAETKPQQSSVKSGPYSGYGNFNAPKYVNPLEGANSPLASGVSSYDPNHPQAQSYVDRMKGQYSQYRRGPNDRQSAADAAALQRSWSMADDLGVDFPLPAGVSAPMTNPIAGYENKPDMIASRNQEAIKRTENLRREEARRNNREAEDAKRSKERTEKSAAKKDSHEPKNPHTSVKKDLHSAVGRHHDWYKNWSATI